MLSKEAVGVLASHDYPGNIRELKNIVERGLIQSQGGDIRPEHLHLGSTNTAPTKTASASTQSLQGAIDALPLNFAEVELALMERALRETDGNIAAAAQAAGCGSHQAVSPTESGRSPLTGPAGCCATRPVSREAGGRFS